MTRFQTDKRLSPGSSNTIRSQDETCTVSPPLKRLPRPSPRRQSPHRRLRNLHTAGPKLTRPTTTTNLRLVWVGMARPSPSKRFISPSRTSPNKVACTAIWASTRHPRRRLLPARRCPPQMRGTKPRRKLPLRRDRSKRTPRRSSSSSNSNSNRTNLNRRSGVTRATGRIRARTGHNTANSITAGRHATATRNGSSEPGVGVDS